MIVDAKPKALGLPTDAYYAVEEVHDVRNLASWKSRLLCVCVCVCVCVWGGEFLGNGGSEAPYS